MSGIYIILMNNIRNFGLFYHSYSICFDYFFLFHVKSLLLLFYHKELSK